MSQSCRQRFDAILLSLLSILLLNHVVIAADDKPWLNVQNADKYVFVGKSVWEIDSGKMIEATGAPTLIVDGRPIVGASDRIFEAGMFKGFPSMPGIGQIDALADGARKMPTIDGRPPASTAEFNNYWAAPDHRRVVWMEKGDYWRGEVDWKELKIINRKQLTSLGVFTPLTAPILWWGNQLYVVGNFDKEKPIVRLNLETGATDEMETYRAFEVVNNGRLINAIVNPSGYRIVNATPSVIYCYDARTGKASMFRNKFEDVTAARAFRLFAPEQPVVWTDDDTVYSYSGMGFIAKLDLRNSRMEIISQPERVVQGGPSSNVKLEGLVPGTHFVDVSTSSGGGQGGPAVSGPRYLVDLTTGKRGADLPFNDKAHGVWLDDNFYIYTVSQGGLSAVGTWYYERSSNTNKRLTAMTIDQMRMVYLKNRKQLWAVSQQSGNQLVKMNLDGSGSQNLGTCELAIPFTLPTNDPIDLGLGTATADLWKAPVVDPASIAATLPPEPAEGKLKLFELTATMSADDRKFAEDTYDYSQANGMFGSYCDPVKVAMKVLDLHKSQPQAPVSNFFVSTDFSDTAERGHIERYGQEHALEMLRSDSKLPVDQKKAIAAKTGPALADAYFKQPKPDLRNMNVLFTKAMDDARASVTGQAVAGSNAPPPPPPPPPPGNSPQNAQSNQPGRSNAPPTPPPPPQQQPPKQSDVEKAAQDAQKARDAANRLRGIFGGR